MSMLPLLVLALSACSPNDGETGSKDGTGAQSGRPGPGGAASQSGEGDAPSDNPPATVTPSEECNGLEATVRDFKESHPDFETFVGEIATTGLVRETLTVDRKPIHASAGPTSQTSGPENFAQWFNDVPGINEPVSVKLPLTEVSPGQFVYESNAFFPIDEKGFGNEGRPHNFHFTTELHTSFKYEGGEVFTFRGDDDVWVFVNGKLALDLGGTHFPLDGTLDFDARAGELGLTPGQTYALDIFHAERHTPDSNFRIQTSIDCFKTPVFN